MPQPWTDAEADHAQAATDLVVEPTLIGELRWVNCETCGGSGEIIQGEAPDQSNELCGACEGTGRDCAVVSPVECGDSLD